MSDYLTIYEKVYIYNRHKKVYIMVAGRKEAQCVFFATFFLREQAESEVAQIRLHACMEG